MTRTGWTRGDIAALLEPPVVPVDERIFRAHHAAGEIVSLLRHNMPPESEAAE